MNRSRRAPIPSSSTAPACARMTRLSSTATTRCLLLRKAVHLPNEDMIAVWSSQAHRAMKPSTVDKEMNAVIASERYEGSLLQARN